MEHEGFISFVLVTHFEGMHFNKEMANGIEFLPLEENAVRFILQPTEPDEDASGHRNGLTCKVYKSYSATKAQMLFVDSYNNKRVMIDIADGISLPYKPKDDILIFEDGTIVEGFSPRRYLCPGYITELIELAESELSENVDRFLKLLRWRQCCESLGEGLKYSSLYWKVGEGDYPIAPSGGGQSKVFTHQPMPGIHWSERHSNDLQNLWLNQDIAELAVSDIAYY
jgi:hypothetical protein